jgi:hypothetical protein
MSNVFTWIYPGEGKTFIKLLKGGTSFKSLGTSALYWMSYHNCYNSMHRIESDKYYLCNGLCSSDVNNFNTWGVLGRPVTRTGEHKWEQCSEACSRCNSVTVCGGPKKGSFMISGSYSETVSPSVQTMHKHFPFSASTTVITECSFSLTYT